MLCAKSPQLSAGEQDFRKSISGDCFPLPVLHGVIPFEIQDFASAFTELHKVSDSPFLHLVQVPLNSNILTAFPNLVLCNLAEYTAVLVDKQIFEGIKQILSPRDVTFNWLPAGLCMTDQNSLSAALQPISHPLYHSLTQFIS